MRISSAPIHISSRRFFGENTTCEIGAPKVTSTSKISDKSNYLKNKAKSILYMDDEATLRLVVRLMLERLGYEVSTAEHGGQALAAYEAKAKAGTPFDAVILDINIENGMNGIETLKKLMQIDPDLCAVGASGSITPETLEGLLQIGFAAVLAKPFRLEQLQKAIEDALSSKETVS